MSQQTVQYEGAFTQDTREIINENFSDLYGAVFTGFTITNAGSVAALGTNQATAAALAYNLNNVTAADGTKGVILPAASAGKVVIVYNAVATNGLPVYPATSGTINGGSANAAATIEGKTLAIFIATDSTNWGAVFTANT